MCSDQVRPCPSPNRCLGIVSGSGAIKKAFFRRVLESQHESTGTSLKGAQQKPVGEEKRVFTPVTSSHIGFLRIQINFGRLAHPLSHVASCYHYIPESQRKKLYKESAKFSNSTRAPRTTIFLQIYICTAAIPPKIQWQKRTYVIVCSLDAVISWSDIIVQVPLHLNQEKSKENSNSNTKREKTLLI